MIKILIELFFQRTRILLSRRRAHRLFRLYCSETGSRPEAVPAQRVVGWSLPLLSIRNVGCTGKKRHRDRQDAKRAARAMRGRASEYHCHHCDGWHVTSKMDRTAAGITEVFVNGERI